MNPKTGGPCQGIRNLNPYLTNQGFDIDVVTFDDNNSDYEDDFNVFKLGKGKTPFYYQPQFYDWLLSNLEHYDVISMHGIWQYHNYAVYKAINYFKNKKRKVPKVIIMPHGMLDPYFQNAKTRKWKSFRNYVFWHLIEKKAINAADAIFFTCEEELLLARTTFKGYHPKKEMNVGYGIVHPPVFSEILSICFKNILPNLYEKPYWLFLSRIHEKKGIDILINAYKKLTRNKNDLPSLVIAGSVDNDYAKEMIKLAESHPNIYFTGMLDGDAKWSTIYNCDAFILPSSQENFGIAIVEAMACKKTVLISKNVNIWRQIENGGGSIVFDSIEIDDVFKALEQLQHIDRLKLKEKGNLAYKTYQSHFTIENSAKVFAEKLTSI
jgi:glycosyltransferase involved in cell wall biosynthesis